MKLRNLSFLIISWFIINNSLFAQSLANYTTARSTGITYSSISATGNAIDSWRNNATFSQDDNRSNLTDIGFDYWYNGVRYTQFSVSTNGYLDFSAAASDGGPTTGAYGYDNTQFTGNGSGTWLALAPFYDDMTAQGGTSALGNSIKYLVTGTAPNRVLTVEWINMAVYLNTTPSLNFQVKLYETSGVIEFVYGTMTQGTPTFSYTCGINAAVLANTPTSAQLLTQQTANTNTFNNTAQNALATLPANNSKISFTPTLTTPAPSGAVTFTGVGQTGMTVNWTNWCSNEVGYVLYNSTDNVNFNFVAQTAANATSYGATGLLPSTLYYWRVYAVTDGALSTALSSSQSTTAAGNVISIATGNWNATTTWNCGCIPAASDNVTIANTHTVTVNSNAVCNTLTIGQGASGILRLGNNNTARTVTVNSNIIINSGATFDVATASNATHLLSLAGNLTNNGTLNFSTDANSFCDITFIKNGNQTLSGTAATNSFHFVTLSMGNSINNTLDISSTNFSASTNFLTLNTGVFKLSTTGTVSITPYTASATIPDKAGLTINSASATVTFGGGITLYGNLISNLGNLNIGNATDENIASYGGGFQIFGGTVKLAGRYYSADINTLAGFTISGGTFTLPTIGSTSTTDAPFQIDAAGSTFNMSGGTIVIEREGGGGSQNLGYTVTGITNSSVTGGTLQIGDASTPASQIMNINSSAWVGNLVVNSANATAILNTNSLTVTNNITITAGTLNANNFNFTLGGNWTNNSSFIAGTGTVIFNGSVPQTIGGTVVSAYANLTINNSTGVTLGLNASVSAILTFTAGVINTGVNKVSITSTGSVSGAGTSKFVNGYLEKNVATGTNISRTYEIGFGTTDYLPLTIKFASVTTAGNITAKVNNGDHPNIATSCIDPAKSVNRYWQLTNTGTVFTNYSATANFIGIPTDADAGSTATSFFMSVYNAGVWTMLTQGGASATSNQGNSITTVGDLQVGEKKPPVITAQPSNISICSGNSAVFTVTATGAGLTYQWQQNTGSGFLNLANGGVYSGVTSATLTISSATTTMNNYLYRCVISVSCGGSATSNSAVLTVNPNLPASVSISASSTTICSGTNVTFTAVPTNGGTTPVYQWKLNGVNVGTNSTTYSNAALTNGNTVTCVMTSNALCATGSPATSNTVTMTVNPNLPASVSISASSTTICPGTNVTFTATPTNGGTTPVYQWKLNGVNVGTNSTTYSNSALVNGDAVTCVITSNALCATGSPATSNTVTIVVNPALPVSVSISANPGSTVCSGTTVIFTATPTNGGGTPVYQWKLNGVNVGTNSATYSNSAFVTGDVITCVLTSAATCGTGSPATSNTVTMTVNPNLPASVSISASSTTICSGANVTFTAVPTNGGTTPVYQWKVNGVNVGTNSTTYSNAALANSDVITCVMTSNAVCATGSPATSNAVTITVNPNLPVSVNVSASSTTICPGTNVTFTAVPTNGGTTPVYQWKLNGVNVGTNSTTYSNAALVNGDAVTCVITSNAVCATGNPATSNTVTMTVNANVVAGISISANPGGAICSGSTVTFTASPTNGGVTPAYQWTLNGVNVGTNSATYSNSALVNGDVITAVLTSNASCVTGNPATSNAITQSVNSSGTWLGVISSDWQNPANWCGGVPTNTTNVVITSGTPFYPVLSLNSFAKNINVSAGTSINLNDQTLNVSGSFSGTGNLKGSLNSSLNIASGTGTAGTFYMDQSAPGNSNSLYSLTMNRVGESVIVGDTLDLINNITITSGTLDANNRLVLVSDASGTARVAPLAAGADVTGNVTMQRYIPAGTDGWMFICAPVSGATLQQWDDDFITGGFTGSQYPPSPNPSIDSYDETISGVYEDGYVGPTNITDPIVARKGYWAYIMYTPLTIDVTGPLLQNLQTLPITYTNDPAQPASENGWNLVANPYPSTIDWDAAGWTKTNINDAIYMYSPTLDQYTSYVGGIGTNGGSNLIASSQAFLVQANAASPVLKLPESAKDVSDGLFIRTLSTVPDDLIKLDLSGVGYTDETVIHFNSGATNNFDLPFDALKFFSFNSDMPGIASMLDTMNMSINTYPLLTNNLSIPVKVKVGISGTYTIRLDSISKLPVGSCIMLQDLLTGIQTDFRTTTYYTFNISDTTSSPRFIINISKPIQVGSVAASCNANPNGAAIATGNGAGPWDYTWANEAGATVQTHVSVAGADTLKNIPAGVYTVVVTGNPGYCNNMTGVIEVTSADSIEVVANVINPSCSGVPDGSINIISANGGTPPYTYSWSNGSSTQNNINISPGTYSLSVTDSTGCIQHESYSLAQNGSLSAAFSVSTDTIYLSSNTLVDFTNNSIGATTYTWDFGNGAPADYSVNPSYMYKIDGIYTVTLIVTDGNCTDTVTQTIVVLPGSVGINELAFGDQILIGNNNPVIDLMFNLSKSTDVEIEVFNSLGQAVFAKENVKVFKNKVEFNFEDKSKGLYYIKISTRDGRVCLKKVVRS